MAKLEFMKMGRSEYNLKPEAQKEPTQVMQKGERKAAEDLFLQRESRKVKM